MDDEFGRMSVQKKEGDELFHTSGESLDFDLLSFWQWSSSDLLSNSLRGVLAEFIIAKAFGIEMGVRSEWDSYDLIMTNGLKIEVKSASFWQSWHQAKKSAINFKIGKSQGWNPDTGKSEKKYRRQADLYIFAILSSEKKSDVDPMNLSQWSFYVLPTTILDAQFANQKTISLSRIRKVCGEPISYNKLKETVSQMFIA